MITSASTTAISNLRNPSWQQAGCLITKSRVMRMLLQISQPGLPFKASKPVHTFTKAQHIEGRGKTI